MKAYLKFLSLTLPFMGLASIAHAETVEISGATIEVQDVNPGRHVTEAVLLEDADLTVDGNKLPLKRGTEIKWWNEIKQLKYGVLRQNTPIKMAGQTYTLGAGTRVDCSSMSKNAQIHSVKLSGDHEIAVHGGIKIKAGSGNAQFSSNDTIANVFGAKEQDLTLAGHKIKVGANSYVGFMDGYVDGKKTLMIWNFQPSSGKAPKIEMWGEWREADPISFKRGKTRLERVFFRGGTAVKLAGQDATLGKAYFNALNEVEKIQLYKTATLKIDGKEQELKGGGTSAFSKGTEIFVTPDLTVASLTEQGLADLVAAAPKGTPAPAPSATAAPKATPGGKIVMGGKRGPVKPGMGASKGGASTGTGTSASVAVKISPSPQLAQQLKAAGAGTLTITVSDPTGKTIGTQSKTVRSIPAITRVPVQGYAANTKRVTVLVTLRTLKKKEYRGQVAVPLKRVMSANVALRSTEMRKVPQGMGKKGG